jgi:hypothetical protein
MTPPATGFHIHIHLVALEAELLGQPHGLAAAILEELGGLHSTSRSVYTLWYILPLLLAHAASLLRSSRHQAFLN